MNKMQISHECPIELLNDSLSFNDYDYCLVHLLDNNARYKDFYFNNEYKDRRLIVDNSIFELGKAYDEIKFIEKIKQLSKIRNNIEYIIPDSLNNKQETINNFIKFPKQDFGKAIGVVQGRKINELIECYKFMSDNADKIAIPFDSEAFLENKNELFKDIDSPFFGDIIIDNDEKNIDIYKLIKWCAGRIHFIEYLIENKIWNYEKPHHLLGCSLAREFSVDIYKNVIETIDTSNPIVSGIKYKKYNKNGLTFKPSIKLEKLINIHLIDEQKEIIMNNIKLFKEITKNNFFVNL